MKNLSLFTGSGIGDWAAWRAGIETVIQCENDPCCLSCMEQLWPDTRKFTDVRDLSVDAIRDLLPIDIVSGGFPCQDISSAGKGAGIEGERSGLWFEMLRIIGEVRPTWVLAENVPTLRVRGADVVLDGLEGLGYACWPVVVGAEHVGAPHKRHRVWIVAHAEQDGRRPWCGEPGDEVFAGCGRGEPAGGSELANAAGGGREGAVEQRGPSGRECEAHAATEAYALDDFRWPSRPGEPQHEREAPRLIELSVGDAVDGLARRLRSRTNKSLLRMAGNGWVPQIPEMIYRWIADHEIPNPQSPAAPGYPLAVS